MRVSMLAATCGNKVLQSFYFLIFFNISIDSIVWNLDDHPENSG